MIASLVGFSTVVWDACFFSCVDVDTTSMVQPSGPSTAVTSIAPNKQATTKLTFEHTSAAADRTRGEVGMISSVATPSQPTTFHRKTSYTSATVDRTTRTSSVISTYRTTRVSTKYTITEPVTESTAISSVSTKTGFVSPSITASTYLSDRPSTDLTGTLSGSV